jgi:hypothetical protein
MKDSIIHDVWKEIITRYRDRSDCLEAIEAYNNSYTHPEKLLPKDVLNYFLHETGDAGRELILQEKKDMINYAQKWGELNNFTITADAEEDGSCSYFLSINELCFEITEDSVKHCAEEYECYLEDGILKPMAEKY